MPLHGGDELFNDPMSADVFMSHQSSYPLEPRNITFSRTMSQSGPDEEYPSNDDSSKALVLSTYASKLLKTKRRQQ